MKRLLFAATLIVATLKLSAQGNQCPGCAINMACNNPSANFPALCPAVLPNGTQGTAYSEDLTFYMPYIIDAQGFSGLHLEEVTVVGISGIPAGMSWTTSHYPTNFYSVTTDPNTQRGCAKICGTPFLSGSYTPTVNVVVKVCNVPIVGCTTLTQTFVLPLEIDAVVGGNPYFTYTPESGCGSVTSTFDALLNLGLPQVTEYAWDFDNGNTSTAQHPPAQTYSTPGEYHPKLTTNIYDLILGQVNANVTGGWWQGIWPCNASRIWFNLGYGTSTYSSSVISDNLSPSWSNFSPAIVLSSNLVTIDFKQKQGVCPTWDGGSMAVQINGPGVYNFTTTAVSNGGGGVNGSFTVLKQLFNSYVTTDTLKVFNLPPLTNIVSSSGSFQVCANGAVTLSVYGGYDYQWYMNDSTAIPGATDSALVLADPGVYPFVATYKVKIIDPHTGCATFTPNTTVTINESIPTAFSTGGIMLFGGQLITNYSGYTYQWLLNGTPLVPSGQTQNYTPTVNGTYRLVATNAFGCMDSSNTISIFNMGIADIAQLEQFISVFPNPSNGEFTVNMEVPDGNGLVISLIDISGKTVHNENIGHYGGTFNKTFNLQHLSAGVYTLSIRLDQGTVRRKLIIQ